MTTFIDQFQEQPDCTHDDELEAVARAMEKLNNGLVFGDYDDIIEEEDDIPVLEYAGACP